MKIIAIGVIVLIILSATSVIVADEVSSGCYIDVNTVKSWVEPPPGLSRSDWAPEGASFVETSIMRSGDSIGFGIARAYSREELLDPDRLYRVLTLIRLSFSAPRIVIRKEDKSPTVTVLLLFALKQNCTDTKLKEKIIDTEKYINKFAGS